MPIMSAPAELLAADCGQEKCRLSLVPGNKEPPVAGEGEEEPPVTPVTPLCDDTRPV